LLFPHIVGELVALYTGKIVIYNNNLTRYVAVRYDLTSSRRRGKIIVAGRVLGKRLARECPNHGKASAKGCTG
jgi:hypothetical protein